MKWFAPVLVALTLISCSNPEVDRLRQENLQLKSQLEAISQERDALKSQVENVRAALGQSSGGTGSGVTTPGSNPDGSSPSPASPSPASPSDGASSSTPPGDSMTSSPQPTTAVLSYAQEVLKLATTYGAQTGTPPTDCRTGYEAGTTRLELGEGIAFKTCTVEKVNDQLRVSLETTDGAKLTVPSNGP